MTKVASIANSANMELETTAAFLSQIIETTQESPETAGTALKTIIARFSEVKDLYSKGELLGTDSEGETIDVNNISKALRTAGINLNEYIAGNKGLDDILIELAEKWDTLEGVQQKYIATMAAGSRQQSRFIALMSDYQRTQELVSAAYNSTGSAQEMYEKTLESLETKLTKLKNAWDEFTMSLANNVLIKAAVDALTMLLTAINKVTGVLPEAGTMITKYALLFTALKYGGKAATGGIAKVAELFGKKFEVPDSKKLDGFKTSLLSLFKEVPGLIQTQIDFKKKGGSLLNPNAEEQILAPLRRQVANSQGFSNISHEDLIGDETYSKEAVQVTNQATVAMKALKTETIAAGGALVTLGQGLIAFSANATGETREWTQSLGEAATAIGTVVGAIGLISQVFKLDSILGIALGKFTLIAATITAIGYALYKFSPAGKLRDAKEAAEESANAAQEAAQAYDNLTSSWDNLNDVSSKLSDMTEGTKEWKEQVLENNKAVLELANTYKGLKIESKNGILSINEDSYDAVLQQTSDEMYDSQIKNAQDQRKVVGLESSINLETYKRRIDTITTNNNNDEETVRYDADTTIKKLLHSYTEGTIAKDYSTDVEDTAALTKIAEELIVATKNNSEIISANTIEREAYIAKQGYSEEDSYKEAAARTYLTDAKLQGSNYEEGLEKYLAKVKELNGSINTLDMVQYALLTGGEEFSNLNPAVFDNVEFAEALTGLQEAGLLDSDQLAILTSMEEKASNQKNDIDTTFGEGFSDNLTAGMRDNLSTIMALDGVDFDKLKLIMSGFTETDELERFLQSMVDSEYEDGDALNEGLQDNINTVINSLINEAGLSEQKEEILEYAQALEEVYGMIPSIAGEIAVQNTRLNEGVKELTENYEDWSNQLKNSPGSPEYASTLTSVKKTINDILNVSDDLSSEFYTSIDALQLMEDVANGDLTAIDKLQAAAAKFQGVELGVKNLDEFNDAIDGLMNQDFIVGATIDADTSGFLTTMFDAMVAANATATQIQDAFNSIGWEPEFEVDTYEVKSINKNTGQATILTDPIKGTVKTIPLTSEMVVGSTIDVPRVNSSGKGSLIGATYRGKSSSIAKASNSGSSSSGGGETPSYWENPYDELYNLNEKINEQIRTREALERKYQKTLEKEVYSMKEVRDGYYAQIDALRESANLQKQLASGRAQQIDALGGQIYTDSDGNRRTFASMGVTKYASYNKETGLLSIDWSGLEAIANDSSREEEGNAAEAYISKLEELVESYEEVRDELWEIEDTIEDLRKEVIDSYLSFEERIMEAIVKKLQQQIDDYQNLSDTISDTNSKVLDSLQASIDLERQIRDNTEKEEEIAEKERRLSYLSRDTSGANQTEILKLQEELEETRESYQDSLIDQAVDQLSKDNEVAAEQRAQQIEIMQAQLDRAQETGELWQAAYDLINEAKGTDGSFSKNMELVQLLMSQEAYKSLSNIGKENWWEELQTAIKEAIVGEAEAEDKYNTDATNDGTIANTGTSAAIQEVVTKQVSYSGTVSNGGNKSSGSGSGQNTPTTTPTTTNKTTTSTFKSQEFNDPKWLTQTTRNTGSTSTKTKKDSTTSTNAAIQEKLATKATNTTAANKATAKWNYYLKTPITTLIKNVFTKQKYATGGLNTETGLAWLDGTLSNPELVLNSQDTKNFIALKDILSSVMKNNENGFSTNSGDNYYDIDIQAEIGSDYDVDQLANKIKRQISEDSMYRNVNTISWIR